MAEFSLRFYRKAIFLKIATGGSGSFRLLNYGRIRKDLAGDVCARKYIRGKKETSASILQYPSVAVPYLNTRLDTAEFPGESAPAVHHNGEIFYRLTPSFWAWVLQAVQKARKATISGKMPQMSFTALIERQKAICEAGLPFADDDLAIAMQSPQRLPSLTCSAPGVGVGGEAGIPATPGNHAGPDDATIDAIAERAWFDPPDFDGGSIAERESMICRLPGFPVMALSPEFVEAVAAHNRRAQERHEIKNHSHSGSSKENTRKKLRVQKSGHETSLFQES